ncbi:hypothetical protein BJ095_110100 [Ureibacillus chungkukjangi]|uniref:Uncharacterized protein n=1 Tax=Ureibacillus chungkukjangi TaxID=1202712 RepID=A0A318TR32_9BACL|nr:hypothetical protein BJ095_110100 [Ureibacillus chungkukjangi]
MISTMMNSTIATKGTTRIPKRFFLNATTRQIAVSIRKMYKMDHDLLHLRQQIHYVKRYEEKCNNIIDF